MKKLSILLVLFTITISSYGAWELKFEKNAYSGQTFQGYPPDIIINPSITYTYMLYVDVWYPPLMPVPCWAEIRMKAKTSGGVIVKQDFAERKHRGDDDQRGVFTNCNHIELYYYCGAGLFADAHVQLYLRF